MDEAALTERVFEHLASGDLTPDHLLEHATFIQKDRFYAPVYVFHGSYEAQWTASFGYDRTETYTVHESRTENGHTRQVPVTKTRIVTDWRPVNGRDSGRFSVRAYAGSRLTGATVDAVSLVEARDLPEATAYQAQFATGIGSEAFIQSDDKAYQARGKAQVNAAIDAGVENHAQGDRQRDWHWTASIQKQATTLLVPVCHVVYEFEGRQFNVWLSGADPGRMLADALPVDLARRKALFLGFAPAGAALVSSGLVTSAFDATWGFPLLVLVAAVAYAGLRYNAIVGHSKRLRQALLAGRRAAASPTQQLSGQAQQALLDSVRRPVMPKFITAGVDKVALVGATVAALLLPVVPLGNETFADWREQRALAETSEEPVGRPVARDGPPIVYQRTQPEPAAVAPVTAVPAVAQADASAEPAQAAATPASQDVPAAGADNPNGAQASNQASNQASVQASLQAPAQAPTPSSAPSPVQKVVQVLRASAAMNWAEVDDLVARMQASPPGYPVGDRKQARAANSEGLALLKAGQPAEAVAALQRGVAADASDIEIRNNLAYALMKAQDNGQAVQVLAQVLAQAPDRSSAWANLSEALDKPGAAQAALRTAVRFSANREKTLVYLRAAVDQPPTERFAATASAVLAEITDIPRHPKDTSAPGDGSARRP